MTKKQEELLSALIDSDQAAEWQDIKRDPKLAEMASVVARIRSARSFRPAPDDFVERGWRRIEEQTSGLQQHTDVSSVAVPAGRRRSSRKIGWLAVAAAILLFTLQPWGWQTANAADLQVTGIGMAADLSIHEALYPRYAGNLDTISYSSGDQVLLWDRASGEASAFPLAFEYMRDMAWSPDGTRAAFSGYKSAKEGPVSPSIWIVGKDGHGFAEIAKPADTDTAFESPSWSPDGSKLIFTATHTKLSDKTGVEYERQIMVINADCTGLIEVAKGSQPSWSPNGKQLSFIVDAADGNQEVWIADADGSNARKVAEGTSPSWSPAGPFLVYTKTRSEHRVLRKDTEGKETFVADVTYQELWAMNLEVGKETRLTQSAFPRELVDRMLAQSDRKGDQAAVYAVSGVTSDEDAAWSSNGSRILFTRNTMEEQGPHYTLQELYVEYKGAEAR